MNVVVTGGSGGLGREVMSRLRSRQVRAVAASRRTGFDLASGEGVREVLADADVIVHAATNVRFRKVDLDGTRRMIRILQERSQPPHLIYVSIVGVDRNPFPYYRAKYACELVLERSGLPVTVVRATQFHTLVHGIGQFAARGPVALAPAGRAAGRGPSRLITLPAVGGALTAFAAGANLPGPDALIGGTGYREWLR